MFVRNVTMLVFVLYEEKIGGMQMNKNVDSFVKLNKSEQAEMRL